MNTYKEKVKSKMDEFVHAIYKATKDFPREELYSTTSQLRRAALSVILNYVEGYARQRPAIQLNFLEISYGSLQESKYLLEFCWKEKYYIADNYKTVLKQAEEIGAILWTEMDSLRRSVNS